MDLEKGLNLAALVHEFVGQRNDGTIKWSLSRKNLSIHHGSEWLNVNVNVNVNPGCPMGSLFQAQGEYCETTSYIHQFSQNSKKEFRPPIGSQNEENPAAFPSSVGGVLIPLSNVEDLSI